MHRVHTAIMRYPFGIPLLLLAILIIGVAGIFTLTVHRGTPAIAFEGRYEVQCTNSSLIVSVHSLERQRVMLSNLTVLENNATCSSTVPYFIVNTQGTISCRGNFSGGGIYTLSFDNRVIKVRC